MGLLDVLGLKRARAEPVARNSYEGQDFSYLFGRTTSGENVDEFKAMQTTAVYACVRILAEAIASLPLHVYGRTTNGKERKMDHPLYFLLHDEPNPEMSSFVFRETIMSHLLIWGNAYVQIIRDKAGRVISLYPLLPDKMSVHRDDSGKLYYKYQRQTEENPNFKDKGTALLKQEDILHVPGLGFDGLIGYSPIAMAKNAIGMTLATENYGAAFFKNGANPGGVLEHPGILKDPKRVRDSWNAVYNGATNAHKVAVLEEGMKYTQVGIPPEEAQFLQTRKFQINEIARLYRIPPHMVGDLEKSSFSNIEQQSLEFVKYTLDPWVVRLEQAFKRSLFLPEEKKRYLIKFNVDGLLRGDYQSRMNGYAIARQNGWLSTNDIRELEDLNLLSDEEGGNLYLINGNMTKLKDAGGFMKQPTETEPAEGPPEEEEDA
ncbi:TPA: phage portal protein [Streptococcus agalactiae]